MEEGARVSVETLFRDMAGQVDLQWAAAQQGGERSLSSEPTVALIGHLNFVHPNRIQVLGNAEMNYLRSLTDIGLRDAIAHLFSSELAAVVVANGEGVPAVLLEGAERTQTPLFTSSLPSPVLMSTLGHYLRQQLAETVSVHGVFLEVLGTGILIKGDAGVGKSELALELITRGHRLVADDVVELKHVAPETLEGSCPPLIRDFLEVRGLGILNIRFLFGEMAVKPHQNLRLIVELVHPEEIGEVGLNRLDMVASTQTILGVAIPKVRVPVAAGRNLAVLVEVAVRNHILKTRGINPVEQFIKRQQAAINGED
ncbi:HPr kinase [Thiobacillus denitrificans ATCC 25259]|uniref:HPr kinase/phosphorylase n=1 Tax=Thiobacillus denitrificans (strain ATCC 25259 / T1) TaxID=292415 RepID=Q3SLD2_THIDA|nr:HPr(Ser) kinase/phosphatase [Thiobacillus denitrificans]AAZ96483.1 HPr kinase [Thiobacillus denitrificans ATCC 25259]